MIFVTVGEQLPFDRLIKTVDKWASISGKDVFAQTGKSEQKLKHIAYKQFINPMEFKDKIKNSELIVAHAGMGTIITALEFGKPILVMPRKAALGEVRSDHQIASAKYFKSLNYVEVAFDEIDLMNKLNNFEKIVHKLKKKKEIDASQLLIKTIRDFISI